MKKLLIFSIFVSASILMGCSSSKNSTNSAKKLSKKWISQNLQEAPRQYKVLMQNCLRA